MGKSRVLGYPPEIFPDSIIQKKYTCEECKRILRIPVQGSCGHRFCRTCVEQTCEQSPNGERLCPACVHSEEDAPETLSVRWVTPDHAVRRALQKVQVHCPNKNCSWTGSLKSYEEHESSCEHRSVTCQCGEVVLVDRLPLHKAHSCPASQTNSPLNSISRMSGEGLEELRRQVQRLETQMALGGLGSKDAALDHIKKLEDRLNAMESVYVAQGSGIGGPGSQLGLSTSPKVSYATYNDLDQYKKILTVVSKKMSALENLSSVLNDQVQDVVSKIRELDEKAKDIEERQQTCLTKVNNFEKILSIHDSHLAELDEKFTNLDQFTTYDGVFYWKIENWRQRAENSLERKTTCIYSPPFYTGRFGYKMCLRLYPRGDGMGKESHVSLFFVVMKGPYDALLTWPFTKKVWLTMIDQTSSKGDHTDSFTPDPNSSSFQRPVNDMNVASGCPRFYDIERLDQQADRFLVNDTMFIKVVVNVDDIKKR